MALSVKLFAPWLSKKALCIICINIDFLKIVLISSSAPNRLFYQSSGELQTSEVY